jgi:hypothetical protein
MRTLLSWALFVAILAGLAYVLAPLVARPLVADVVRAASPFGSEPLQVDVSADAFGLLQGRIDSVHVTGPDLTSERATIGHLNVSAAHVGMVDHTFTSMSGSLDSVVVTRADGSSVQLAHVDLSGPSDRLEATARIDRAAALAIVGQALAGAGLPIEGAELIDGGVRLSVLGQRTDVAIGVDDGAVTIAGSIGGGGSIVVFGREPGDPWRITGVSASPDGLDVHAVIDLGSVLR